MIANAPVSYGVFELSVGTERFLGSPQRVLDAVAAAGYEGIDLGPVGYLGLGAGLADALERRNLGLAGGYIDLPFSEPERLTTEMARLDELLDAFDAAPQSAGRPRPRPTLATQGSPGHHRRPGAAAIDHSLGFDDAGWLSFQAGLASVVERCRARGYEPTFHPHVATWIEAPHEIERLLTLSDVGLCLDTGHLIVGGGDPVALLRAWAPRINQVHFKDVRRAVLAQVTAEGGSAHEIWGRRVFCPLGKGDVDVAGVVEALRDIRYEGWIVVEQDVFTTDATDFEQAIADQQLNLATLRASGLG